MGAIQPQGAVADNQCAAFKEREAA